MEESAGSEALLVDHGYYNYTTIPTFHCNRFAITYAKYKKKFLIAAASRIEGSGNDDAAGELASE